MGDDELRGYPDGLHRPVHHRAAAAPGQANAKSGALAVPQRHGLRWRRPLGEARHLFDGFLPAFREDALAAGLLAHQGGQPGQGRAPPRMDVMASFLCCLTSLHSVYQAIWRPIPSDALPLRLIRRASRKSAPPGSFVILPLFYSSWNTLDQHLLADSHPRSRMTLTPLFLIPHVQEDRSHPTDQ